MGSYFSQPILFSSYFNISPLLLEEENLIDSFLTVDTHLFVDPILLEKSNNKIIREDAYRGFCDYFEKIVRLLSISKAEGDIAWRTAQKRLNLSEPPANGLGYGNSKRSGASRPDTLRDTILRTLKEIITLGVSDPEMISLMGFFEKNVGPDTISDLTSRIIEPQLATITHNFCVKNGIDVKNSQSTSGIALPHYRNSEGKERPVVLVPADVVRALPIANDWSDLEEAVNANREIRERVNLFLSNIVRPTVGDRKDAVRKAALHSENLFNSFLVAMKFYATNYDQNTDALGYYSLRKMLLRKEEEFKVDKKYEISQGIDEIKRVVRDSIAMFKHHVEKGNLWEELWIDNKPKRERAAQLLYYAISDCFCRANNVDISPEANMGGGPVDFKYSKGYEARILVEMKRSCGKVVHGYEHQLDIYKDAARSSYGFFVIMDYGDMGKHLDKIQNIRKNRIANGESASEIIVIDATQKVSASKRK